MKNEFVLAFNEMLDEKQLPRDTVIKALESAMVSAYRKAVVASAAQHIEAKLDPETGNFLIYAEKEVVDEVVDERTEVLLADARKVMPDAEIGDMAIVESTPKDFGRVAAQTARQVIQQRLRDAERMDQIEFYEKKVGEIVSGVVQSISNDGYTIGLDKKAEGTLLRKDVIKGERFRLHEHVRALIVEVKDTARNPQILLSRTDRKFLFRLLEIDVPEIFHGIVEVRSIAREPGARAKIAVSATQQGIDPVGACVGIQGKRIQPIVKELHDEKIDVIEWNPDPAIFISKAISPAKVVGVYLGNGKTATVVVPEDQLSLAIGRDGQNARLAAKLTSWRIDIKSVTEAASDIIGIFESKRDLIEHNDETDERTTIITHKELFDGEEKSIDSIRVILSKRNEGRNLSVDEIETLNRFVDRIEKRKVAGFNESNVSEVIRTLMNSQLLKEDISKKHINESGLPKHVAAILQNAGLFTFGDLYERMKKDPDEIFKLQGISTKSMNEIASLVKFIGISTSVEPNMQTVPTEMNSDSGIASESTALEVPAEVENQAETEPEKLIAETVIIPQVQTESEMTESTPEKAVEQEETEEISFDELFNTIRTDAISHVDYIDDEDEDRIDGNSKKDKKKKKKKNVQVEYDPESDVTLVHKKHKRTDDEDWGW